MKGKVMNQGSTMFLRVVVLLLGVVVLALSVFALPVGIRESAASKYELIFWGMYVTVVPFFVALFHTLKLLQYIDKNRAFSVRSIRSLKYIKYCALIISILYTIGMPQIYLAAEEDDAPGVILIGLVLAFAPLVIAVFAAVLQKLLQNAIAIKSENDLTV